MSKKEELDEVKVVTMDELEEMTEDKPTDEPKLGIFKRIRNGARNFGENHPKVTSVLKSVGLIGVGIVAGISGATIAERMKWSKEDESDGENYLPEEITIDDQEEFSGLDNESSEG